MHKKLTDVSDNLISLTCLWSWRKLMKRGSIGTPLNISCSPMGAPVSSSSLTISRLPSLHAWWSFVIPISVEVDSLLVMDTSDIVNATPSLYTTLWSNKKGVRLAYTHCMYMYMYMYIHHCGMGQRVKSDQFQMRSENKSGIGIIPKLNA